jgi:hypothetical protein
MNIYVSIPIAGLKIKMGVFMADKDKKSQHGGNTPLKDKFKQAVPVSTKATVSSKRLGEEHWDGIDYKRNGLTYHLDFIQDRLAGPVSARGDEYYGGFRVQNEKGYNRDASQDEARAMIHKAMSDLSKEDLAKRLPEIKQLEEDIPRCPVDRPTFYGEEKDNSGQKHKPKPSTAKASHAPP